MNLLFPQSFLGAHTARTLAATLALYSGLAWLPAHAAEAHDPCPGAVINTNGSSEMVVSPDSFRVQATTQARGKSTTDATEAGNLTMAALKQKIQSLKIAGLQLKTTQYTTYPIWEDNKKTPTAYQHTQTLQLQLEGINNSETLASHANKVLAAMGSVAGVQPADLNWYLSQHTTYEAELLTQAVKQAKQRASTMATAAGMTLGNACDISYQSAYRVNVPMVKSAMAARMDMMEAEAPQVESGEQTVSAHLQIRFLMAP